MQGGYDAEMDARGNVVVEGWARRNFPTTTDYTPQSKVIAVIGLAFVTLSKRQTAAELVILKWKHRLGDHFTSRPWLILLVRD